MYIFMDVGLVNFH